MTATGILQPEKSHGFLYRLTFPNGKAYIGITNRTVSQRFSEHVALSKSGKRGSAIHHAIRKFGESSVQVETLGSADWDSLKLMEISAISGQNTRPPYGYNLTKGGDGVVGFDAITRAKMGAANIGRIPTEAVRLKISEAQKGRKASQKARENISTARVGMVFSAAHKDSLSAARNRYVANNPAAVMSDATRARMAAVKTGLSHTAETREKLRAINTGKTLSIETRKKQSEANAAQWADPEWREKTLKSRLEKRLQKA